MALELSRTRDDDDTGLFAFPAPPRLQRALTFAERGYRFVPLLAAHLELFLFLYGRDAVKIEECVGKTLVDARCLPLGAVLVWFQPGGKNWLYGEFGQWLKIFPKDILRAMREVANDLRDRGITTLHCTADPAIEGSDKLVRWLKREPTGERDGDLGPIYRIDLRATPI
jgi:hypothetical protein